MKHLKAIYLVLFIWELMKKIVLFCFACVLCFAWTLFLSVNNFVCESEIMLLLSLFRLPQLRDKIFLMFFLPCWLILTVLKINGGLPVRSFLWRDSRRNYLLWTYREERASSLNAAGRQTSTVQYSSIFLISEQCYSDVAKGTILSLWSWNKETF